MFEKIEFDTYESNTRLTSKKISDEDLNNKKYNRENLLNSNFCIWGSVDSFRTPPITEFATNNLFHLQDFNIFHYKYGSYTERKNFHSFLILYTYSGSGQLTYDNHTYSLTEGDGFFINCMDYHLYKVENRFWDTAVLHINGPLLPALHTQYMQNGSPIFHEPVTGKYQQLLEHLLRLYSYPQLYRDWQASTCIDNMLTDLLLMNTKEASKKKELPKNIQFLIRYMEHNYSSHLTLDYLASFSNTNKYYLSKEFKRYTGFSPNDYLISLRINQAKNLLKNTTLPASKIAHEVGIHDTNNFINHFKKRTGMTPIQYRNSDTPFA